MDRRKMWIAVALVVVALGVAGCGTTGSDDVASDEGGGGADAAQVSGETSGEVGYIEETGGGGSAATLPSIGAAVIKTAEIEIEVDNGRFSEALQEALRAAETNGGYVLSTSVEGEDRSRGSVVIRVPVDAFDATLADLEDTGEIQSEEVSGQDVTQEFIDLEARLRNLRAQEDVLLDLMREATTVDETIRVQRELTPVQLEIERIRGRLNYLEDQTAFSTIEAKIFEQRAAAAGPPGMLEKAWDRATEGFLAVVAGMIVATGVLLPLALLALVVFLMIRLAMARLSARRAAAAS